MAEGRRAADPHDLNLTHDSEEGAQPSYGPASDSTPLVQRFYRPTTTGEKEAVQSAVFYSADSRLDSAEPGVSWTASLTKLEPLATTSTSSHSADSDTSAQSSTGQVTDSNCDVPVPPPQASHSPACGPEESIVLRRNTIPVSHSCNPMSKLQNRFKKAYKTLKTTF